MRSFYTSDNITHFHLPMAWCDDLIFHNNFPQNNDVTPRHSLNLDTCQH